MGTSSSSSEKAAVASRNSQSALDASQSRGASHKEVIALSLPIAGVQLANVALTSTDVAMLGTLGVTAIGAGGLAMQFYNQIRTMCVGMVTASGNKIAEAYAHLEKHRESGGYKEDDELELEQVRRHVRVSFAVGTATAIVGAVIILALGALLFLLPVDRAIARVTFGMTLTLAPGLIPMLWLNVLRQFAVGMRKPGSLLIVTLWSIAVNAGLNWLMISLAPSPGWSVAGIGFSTTLVQCFTLAVFARRLRRDPELGRYFSITPKPGDLPAAWELVRIGIPVSLTYGSEAALTTIAGLTMGMVSPVMLAAHTVVNQIAYIVYQVCIGFSHGGSILISRSATAPNPRAEVGMTSRRIGQVVAIYLGAISLVWICAGHWIVRLFAWDATDSVYHVATILMFFAIGQQWAKGIQNVAVGILRGLKDTTSGLKATLIGYWALGVPAIVILGLLVKWEAYGVWGGLILGFGTTAILLVRKVRSTISHLAL